MAELKVEIVKIYNVEDHPNADRLDIISIEGMDYKVITGKGNLNVGELAFYFPVDSVLPDILVEEFNINSYYKNRIRAAKLRGVFSEGLLISVSSYLKDHPEIIGYADIYNEFKWEVGEDFTDFFGVIKYIVPVNESNNTSNENILSAIGSFKFDSPEHFKKYNNILIEGETVCITEKIHGTNFTVFKDVRNEIFVGSHNYFWKLDSNNCYTRIIKENLELIEIPPNTQLFGEIYGVQDIKYDCKPGEIKYAIFAIKQYNKYLNLEDFAFMCNSLRLNKVPVLYLGKYSKDIVLSYNNKMSCLNDKCIMEGVAIIPEIERWDYKVGRVCLKYISEQYLLRKNGTENK
jgi:RNA ligase (TIGR02306 family)